MQRPILASYRQKESPTTWGEKLNQQQCRSMVGGVHSGRSAGCPSLQWTPQCQLVDGCHTTPGWSVSGPCMQKGLCPSWPFCKLPKPAVDPTMSPAKHPWWQPPHHQATSASSCVSPPPCFFCCSARSERPWAASSFYVPVYVLVLCAAFRLPFWAFFALFSAYWCCYCYYCCCCCCGCCG